ncbi:dienelactone hydrolase family protein [Flavobacterium silvaticum]|uniref:Dienelactone hydrolase family protein n=1 Tax=Flavobacterium silvaticum TaxID=1852020 RepID=A0A972FKI2_9FLAO|nr:dienelactone hydrolase family protein [Flavobacterium silvaticum]NMH27362.1 dienelactone hydrolase family protein [Flavobacterium silvaticum]
MKKLLLFVAITASIQINAQLRTISYNDKSQQLNGMGIAPEKPLPGKPGILILPAWMGITQHEKDVATELAAAGYYVFIADIYGLGHYPTNTQEAGAEATKYKSNPELYQRRIKLALEQLPGQGADYSRLAAIGYCFGGAGVLEMARSGMGVWGVISVHGSLGKDASRKDSKIKAKVLALHGADDPYVTPQEVAAFEQEMRNSKADWQLVSYGNAVHAFSDKAAGNDNSKGAAYNESADKRSKKAILDFLEELFAKK